MFKHIVVGVDGREGGRDAVALARLLAPVGGTLTLLVVGSSRHGLLGRVLIGDDTSAALNGGVPSRSRRATTHSSRT
jgi:nucleotide-binding universal stress UspA family protein